MPEVPQIQATSGISPVTSPSKTSSADSDAFSKVLKTAKDNLANGSFSTTSAASDSSAAEDAASGVQSALRDEEESLQEQNTILYDDGASSQEEQDYLEYLNTPGESMSLL